MRRKRIKRVANIDFGYRSITDAKQYIKIFLKSPACAALIMLRISTASLKRKRESRQVSFGTTTVKIKRLFKWFCRTI